MGKTKKSPSSNERSEGLRKSGALSIVFAEDPFEVPDNAFFCVDDKDLIADMEQFSLQTLDWRRR